MFGGMKIYTVHAKPDMVNAAEKPKFVREGFNLFAFLFTGLWTLYHRLWWPTAILVAVNVALIALGKRHLFPAETLTIIQVAVQILVGYMANDWLRAKLQRRGYVIVDIVAADSELRAEQRYFDRYLASAS